MKKKVDQQKQNKKEELTKKLEPILYEYLIQDDSLQTRLLQKDERSSEVLIQILEKYGEVLSGNEIQEKITKLADEVLIDYLTKQLNHRRWSIRMNTLYHIEDFKLVHFAPIIWKKFDKRENINTTELFQLMRVLAVLRHPPFLDYLINTKEIWPRFIYKDILRRIDDVSFDLLVNKFDYLNELLKQAIVEIIGEKRLIQYSNKIENLLLSDHLEVRLSALRVLTSFGFISDVNKLTCFSQSEQFAERMMFAKICGTMKLDEFINPLILLIKDKDWFVRNAAGEAISNLQNGSTILSEIIQHEKDTFARDMAQQWISKGEIE